jgi:amino acid transporter
MSRRSTVAVLFGLLILADLIVLKHVLSLREELSFETFIVCVSGCSLSATGFIALGIAILRKKHRRQKKPVKVRARLAVAGH